MAEYAVVGGDRIHVVRVSGDGATLQASLDGQLLPVRVEPVAGSTCFRFVAGDRAQPVMIRRSGADIIVTLDDEQYRLRVEPAVPIARRTRAIASGAGEVRAPMPGLVVSVDVVEGDTVEQGRPVAVMEAMKMQSELRTPLGGIVTAVHVKPGQEVMGGTVLVTVAPRERGTGNSTQRQGTGDKG